MDRRCCPIAAFVLHREVEDYLRLGWMTVANLGEYHGQFSVLMGWPCSCVCVVPE
jgi:hypothetical protein